MDIDKEYIDEKLDSFLMNPIIYEPQIKSLEKKYLYLIKDRKVLDYFQGRLIEIKSKIKNGKYNHDFTTDKYGSTVKITKFQVAENKIGIEKNKISIEVIIEELDQVIKKEKLWLKEKRFRADVVNNFQTKALLKAENTNVDLKKLFQRTKRILKSKDARKLKFILLSEFDEIKDFILNSPFINPIDRQKKSDENIKKENAFLNKTPKFDKVNKINKKVKTNKTNKKSSGSVKRHLPPRPSLSGVWATAAKYGGLGKIIYIRSR